MGGAGDDVQDQRMEMGETLTKAIAWRWSSSPKLPLPSGNSDPPRKPNTFSLPALGGAVGLFVGLHGAAGVGGVTCS
jgi:hypothetical protein